MSDGYDLIAEAVADGRLRRDEVDIVRRLHDMERRNIHVSGGDPDDDTTWLEDCLEELPADRAAHYDASRGVPVAASADQDMGDAEFAHLFPPTAVGSERLAASAGPWGSGDPVNWAVRTGRLTPTSAAEWRGYLARDPAGTMATLTRLTPFGELVQASSGSDDDTHGLLYRPDGSYAPPTTVAIQASADDELTDAEWAALFGPRA